MTERGLNHELGPLLDEAPGTKAALRLLADCNDLDLLYALIDLCITVEGSYPSQGWRIAWTSAVDDAMVRTIATQNVVTERQASDAYWNAAAKFADGVASHPDEGVEIPPQGVNIGWILGTGPAHAAREVVTLLGMEATVALAE